jgi:hypothetical protein
MWALDAMMPKSTDEANSKGFLDHADNATMFAGVGMVKNVTKIPKLIKASKIYLSHPAKLSSRFSNPAHGTVGDLARKLKNGQIQASDIPPIEVTKINGKLYSANNRRLKAFQEAGAEIRTVPASKEQVRKIKQRLNKKR